MLFGFIWVNRRIGELANERYVSIFGFVYKEKRNYFCSCLRSWTSFQSLQSVKTRDIRSINKESVCVHDNVYIQCKYSSKCMHLGMQLMLNFHPRKWIVGIHRLHAPFVLKGFSGYCLMKSLKIFQHTKIGMVEYCVVLLLIMLI